MSNAAQAGCPAREFGNESLFRVGARCAVRCTSPSTFLTALHLVGDESCLPAIASAHKRAANDPRWHQQLEAAFQAIVTREKLSRKPAAKLLREPRRGWLRWPVCSRAAQNRRTTLIVTRARASSPDELWRVSIQRGVRRGSTRWSR